MKKKVSIILFFIIFCITSTSIASTIVIPDGTKIIGAEAFLGDICIEDIVIPNSVEEIGENAFDSTALKHIYCETSSYAWNWFMNHGYASKLIDPYLPIDEPAYPYTITINNARVMQYNDYLSVDISITNGFTQPITETVIAVDFYDAAGNQKYTLHNNEISGGIVTNTTINPNETLNCPYYIDFFNSNNPIKTVQIAICQYTLEDGTTISIPDNQLYWFNSETGYLVKPSITSPYSGPDETINEKASHIKYGLYITTVYSYMVSPYTGYPEAGILVKATENLPWLNSAILEGDLIYGIGNMRWVSEPNMMTIAAAKLYEGYRITFKIIRNGVKIETQACWSWNPIGDWNFDEYQVEDDTPTPTPSPSTTTNPDNTPTPPPDETVIPNAIRINQASIVQNTANLTINLSLTNGFTQAATAINLLIDYYDNNGKQKYITNSGRLVNGVNSTVTISANATVDSPIYIDSFTSSNPVSTIRVAVAEYTLSDGTTMKIPDNQLCWFHSISGYQSDPTNQTQYTGLDTETIQKASNVSFGISYDTVYSYIAETYTGYPEAGILVKATENLPWLNSAILEGDLIYGIGNMRWVSEPNMMTIAAAKLYEGYRITFKIIRNGVKIETQTSWRWSPIGDWNF